MQEAETHSAVCLNDTRQKFTENLLSPGLSLSFRQKDFSNKKDFTLKVTSKNQLRVCKSLLLIKKGLINLYLFLFF